MLAVFVWYLFVFFLTFLGKSVIDDLILRDIFLRFVFRADENLNQLIQGEETQELRKVLKALFPSQAETEEPR